MKTKKIRRNKWYNYLIEPEMILLKPTRKTEMIKKVDDKKNVQSSYITLFKMLINKIH